MSAIGGELASHWKAVVRLAGQCRVYGVARLASHGASAISANDSKEKFGGSVIWH